MRSYRYRYGARFAVQLIDRIDRRIKLHDLRILMTVVQCGSMGKAAQVLHTSQPAISRSISGLEHAVGRPLLERTVHGVEPTEYGRALLDGGVAMFDELRLAVTKIEFLADPTAGEVRVGSTVFTAATFVSAVVDRFSRRYPSMTFQLVTAPWEGLHRELSERKLELLITRKFGPDPEERLDFEFLFDESFVVAAGVNSPLARRRKVALSELVNESWVLPPPESAISSIAMHAFTASGVDYPRPAVVTLTPEVRMSLVATGRFITIFPASTARLSVRRSEIKVLPVKLPLDRVPTGIVTLKNRRLSAVAKLFIASARGVAKGMLKDLP